MADDTAAAAAAAALLDHLANLPLLSAADKTGVLRLIKAALADCGAGELVARSGRTGISVFRSSAAPAHPAGGSSANKIYRITGSGEVAAGPAAIFELLCSLEAMPQWDMLVKHAAILSHSAHPTSHCAVATVHIIYGLPGVSRVVSDRDFLLRVSRVQFPSGLRVLHCRSLPPGDTAPGDPGPQPCVIRGHMFDSGYVVLPSPTGASLAISLQVDPRGWIPVSVVNWALEAVPLNISRIRATLARLDPAALAQLAAAGRAEHAAAQAAAGRSAAGGALSSSKARRAGGGSGGSSSSVAAASSALGLLPPRQWGRAAAGHSRSSSAEPGTSSSAASDSGCSSSSRELPEVGSSYHYESLSPSPAAAAGAAWW